MIIGFADVISQSPHVYGGRLPASLLTDIAAIRRNAEHLATLVNDVLDLSQVEAGRMALRRDWVAVEPMIQESLAVVKGLFESRGLYLHSEIDAGLPPVFCDATRIRQVIINLLGNAGRFTEQGGVVLRCVEIDHSVVISVADTGPGIAPKDQERIFEPFQQVDVSTRRRHGGSGLGLTISKQFVEMHGGQMWLESEVDIGTTIYVSLPLNVPSSLPITSVNRVRRSITPDDQMGYRIQRNRSLVSLPALTERFVVVDGEGTVQRLFERYLPTVEVESVADTASAQAALQRSPAQALIFNRSPFDQEPTELLADLPFSTPVFTCWLPGEQEAARHLGVVEYLIKPLSSQKLHAALSRVGSQIKTILIVDDDEDELHLFARMLASNEHRYSTLQVTSGQRALNMLRNRRPDIVLLDLMMPGMSGFQVLEEKARDATIADIPVIIISSLDTAVNPMVGSITIRHAAGISQRNLISCICALGEILTPSAQTESS
jgi:CheY-like chemotaxis protein